MRARELCVITCYFNPCGYVTRRNNYALFMQGMQKAGVTCITVECAFGDQPFELQPSMDVIQVRTDSLLWQKERLLNLAAEWLPRECRYVAWFDCDILFANPNWPNDLVRELQHNRLVQVFDRCIRLQQGNVLGETPDIVQSFGSVMSRNPEALDAARYDTHGHTGFCWALHRDIFDEVGLYEAAVSGSADHFMCHAAYDQYNFCVKNALKHDTKQISHLQAWGKRFHRLVQGKVGYVPGHIRHLWHGDTVNRRYFLRMHEITDLGFNPWTDLHAPVGAPLEWAQGMDKPGLKAYFSNYFAARREDGVAV